MADAARSSVAGDLELAVRLADKASAMALGHLARGITSERKADGTIVTDADLGIERFLRNALASHRPGDAVLGEELGGPREATRRWIIDPIDGTMNFVAGRPDWGVHLALEEHGRVVAGVVTRPASGTRWWAGRGCGAYVGPTAEPDAATPLHVSRNDDLASGRLSAWLPDGDPVRERLRSLPAWTEHRGLDTIMDVANGDLDAFVDGTASRIWDCAPLAVIVEEAGGRYRDRTGGDDLDLPGGLLTNGRVDADLDVLLVDAPS